MKLITTLIFLSPSCCGAAAAASANPFPNGNAQAGQKIIRKVRLQQLP